MVGLTHKIPLHPTTKIEEDIILGRDWLGKTGAEIDYQKRQVRIKKGRLTKVIRMIKPPTLERPQVRSLDVAMLFNDVKTAQINDPTIQAKIRTMTGLSNRQRRRLHCKYAIQTGFLYKKFQDGHRIVVPEAMKQRVLLAYHDDVTAGHPGAQETIRAIKRIYYIHDLSNVVRRYVARCSICKTCKPGKAQAHMPLLPKPPARPWEAVSIVVMGPYPETEKGNRFVIVLCDLFSRWVEAKATKEARGADVIQFLEENIVSRHGYPRYYIILYYIIG